VIFLLLIRNEKETYIRNLEFRLTNQNKQMDDLEKDFQRITANNLFSRLTFFRPFSDFSMNVSRDISSFNLFVFFNRFLAGKRSSLLSGFKFEMAHSFMEEAIEDRNKKETYIRNLEFRLTNQNKQMDDLEQKLQNITANKEAQNTDHDNNTYWPFLLPQAFFLLLVCSYALGKKNLLLLTALLEILLTL
jgi:uncharacterized coiled-coil protein SlyX